MQKLFCDCCGNQIVGTNVAKNASNPTRLGNVPARLSNTFANPKIIAFEIMTSMYGGPWDSGDYCKYCIIDAVKELDDRPQPAPAPQHHD